jgi:hypothetical protein
LYRLNYTTIIDPACILRPLDLDRPDLEQQDIASAEYQLIQAFCLDDKTAFLIF